MKKSLLMIFAMIIGALSASADITWKKVTEAPESWEGTYMIVAEGALDGTKTVYYDGSLTDKGQNGSTRTLRTTDNLVETTISEGAFTTTDDSQSFSIEKFAGENLVLKSKTGYYIYLDSSLNGLEFSSSPMNHYVTVALNADATINITCKGGGTLQCGGSSSNRFFFWTSAQSAKTYLYAPTEEIDNTTKDPMTLTLSVADGNITMTPNNSDDAYVYGVVSASDYAAYFEKHPAATLTEYFKNEVLFSIEDQQECLQHGEQTVAISSLNLEAGDYKVFAAGIKGEWMGSFYSWEEELLTEIQSADFTVVAPKIIEPVTYGTFTTSPAPVNGEWQAGTKFYTIKVKRAGYLASDRASAGYLTIGNSSKPTNDAGKWAFVQTEGGIQIYNKATGTDKVLTFQSTNDAAHCSMGSDLTAETSYFECVTSQNPIFLAGAECFKITGTEAYLNGANNGAYYLNVWTSDQALWGWAHSSTNPTAGDDGSQLQIVLAEELTPVTYTINVVGAPEGAEVSVSVLGEARTIGTAFTVSSSISDSDVETSTFKGYSSAITIDNEAGTITVTYTFDPYPVNFDKATAHGRSERKINSIQLGEQTIEIANPNVIYHDLTETQSFTIEVGQEVKPAINWTGAWMHGYVYVDKDASDFEFTTEELVASAPKPSPEANVELDKAFSTFTITEAGDYRMRYKVDWNNTDAKGSDELVADGGYIIDVMLHVVGPEASFEGVISTSLDAEPIKTISQFEGITLTFEGAKSLQLGEMTEIMVTEANGLNEEALVWNNFYTTMDPSKYNCQAQIEGNQITLTGFLDLAAIIGGGGGTPYSTRRKAVAAGDTDYQYVITISGIIVDGDESTEWEQYETYVNYESQTPAGTFELVISNNGIEARNGESVTASTTGVSSTFVITNKDIAATGNGEITLTVAAGSDLNHGSVIYNAAGLLTFQGEGETLTSTLGEYTLTIPAGAFVSAEGLNEEYTATWNLTETTLSISTSSLQQSAAARYDLQGRRINALQRGISIIGGKKMVK